MMQNWEVGDRSIVAILGVIQALTTGMDGGLLKPGHFEGRGLGLALVLTGLVGLRGRS